MTFSLQYRGFDYVAFYNSAFEDANSLSTLVQTGANSIEVTAEYGINVLTSQVVRDPNYTDSLAALGQTISQAENRGLSVMVRPLIDFLNPATIAPYAVGDWRQNYQPANVAAFFASYKQMIVAEAQVGQQNGAQMVSIGGELDQLTGAQYLPYWTDIINSVHAVFSGKLIYSASWNTASNVSFWSQLDYEGIDCYVPLSNAQHPTLQNLINGWITPATQATNPDAYAVIGNQSPIHYFENLSAQSGKPLIFTELGYANSSTAAADPAALGNNPDPALQASLYHAFFQAWAQSGSSSLIGTYFWEWDPNGSAQNVGPNIVSFSPQNGPAQNEAAAGFAATVPVTGQVTSADIQAANLGILRVADTIADASAVAASINSGALTVANYVNQLIDHALSTTLPAVAVEAMMYGKTGTSAEITSLTLNFLPPQVANAAQHGFYEQIYACEALGLAFAFGSETGARDFYYNFGPFAYASDATFATAASKAIFGSASTANLVSVLQGFVGNWKTFFTANGVPGLSNVSAADVDLAARGAAFGDMVGVALADDLGPLKGQVINFLEDAAQGTAVYGASLVGQPAHQPFQGA